MIKYKNYEIIPQTVCFSIRYFVYGDGFCGFEHFESISIAEKEIDKRIAHKFLENILNGICLKMDISKDILLECITDLLKD